MYSWFILGTKIYRADDIESFGTNIKMCKSRANETVLPINFYKTHLVKPVKIQNVRRSSKILGLQKYRCAGSFLISTFEVSKMWQFLVLCQLSINVNVNCSSPSLFFLSPLLSFTIYIRGVSSVAEERLSSVRLTHLPLNNLITLQNNAGLSFKLMLYCPYEVLKEMCCMSDTLDCNVSALQGVSSACIPLLDRH